MEVLTLQVFVSLVLVLGSLVLFAKTWKSRDFDHADRLALFPLDEPGEKPTEPRSEESAEQGNP